MKRKVRFVPPRQSQNPWRDKGMLITLDVAKLDKAWRYNRVPEGGGSDPEAIFKYQRAKQWLSSSRKVELWATTVAMEEEEGAVCFVEGRHSFAVLRDLGYLTVDAWAHRDEARELMRRYGPK